MSRQRIALVSMADLFATPYIEMYEQCFNGEYDLIYWPRSGERESRPRMNPIPYKKTYRGMIGKALGYLGFRKHALKVIKDSGYEKIIFLQTQPAILLADYLTKRFSGEYACDIRDYSFEHVRPFFRLEEKVLSKSKLNVISSPGFKSFLPKGLPYHMLHNSHSLEALPISVGISDRGIIVITYIGSIRFYQQCRRFLMLFGGDKRFVVRFCGAGADELHVMCTDLDLSNVEFIDRFDSSRTLEMLEGTNLIFNLYGNHTPLLDYAPSNKLYYAAELGIPILTCPDTAMSEIASRYGLGIDVDLESEDAPSALANQYAAFDWARLEHGRREMLDVVKKENCATMRVISDFLSGKEAGNNEGR